MCSCPSTLGIAKHLEGTGYGTNLTPDDMLLIYSIHNQAKANMLRPPSKIWRTLT